MITIRHNVLQRSISAEVRAIMASRRVTAVELAPELGRSQNYLSKRLRDELPFNVTDLERLGEFFGIAADELVSRAVMNHAGEVTAEPRKRVSNDIEVQFDDSAINPLEPTD